MPADGGPDVQSLADLCGTTVAVERGTIQATASEGQSKKCTAAGKDAGQDRPSTPTRTAPTWRSRAAGRTSGWPTRPSRRTSSTKSNGQFKLTGGSFGDAPYGIAIPQGNGMAKPVQAAMQSMIDDGTYAKILDYWGI